MKTSPLVAAAAVASATGFLTVSAPAQALPPVPLAPPACQQWGFTGPTSISDPRGIALTFNSTGPVASGNADFNPNGILKHGTVAGGIDPNGHVSITFTDDDVDDPGSASYNGDVGPDGQVTNANWKTTAPLACVTQAAQAVKEGPSISLDPGFGGLTVHITDHSGVTSQCQYSSDFVNRSFRLPANSTFDMKIVPAVPMFIDHQVDITCDNAAETHTTAFF